MIFKKAIRQLIFWIFGASFLIATFNYSIADTSSCVCGSRPYACPQEVQCSNNNTAGTGRCSQCSYPQPCAGKAPTPGSSGGGNIPIPITPSLNPNSQYACCDPTIIRFANSGNYPENGCPAGQTIQTCNLELPVTSIYTDCPGNGTSPAKMINVTASVNCDMTNSSSYNLQNSTDKSCINVPNFFGMVVNTISTLGISIAMMDNFHSTGIGHANSCGGAQYLEGAYINMDLLMQNYCGSSGPPGLPLKDCIKYLLQGYYVSETNNNCTQPAGCNCSQNPGSCLVQIPDFNNNPTQAYLTNDPCASYPNYDKPALDGNGNFLVDGKTGQSLYCPITRCNMPTNNMLVNYDDLIGEIFGYNIGTNNYPIISSGSNDSVGTFGIIQLAGITDGPNLCTQMLFTLGYTTISCKPLPPPTSNWPTWNFACVSPNCYVNPAASPGPSGGYQVYSKAFAPITSKMMQCIQETITSLVQGNADSVGCNYTMLANFQMQMRDAVKAALILYVILFGISIALRGELPKKSELFLFLAKFAFVIWAAIGTFDSTGVECTGTKWCPTNGLEFIYTSAVAALESFPQMLIGAACDPSQNTCICNYPASLYEPGYEYLSLWDSIDCRLSYYLGLVSPTSYGNTALSSGMGLFSSGGIGMMFALIFSFEILILLLLICFTVFFLSITIFFANIYILCLISLTILIYIGPIFVPLILFTQTKENFMAWARLVLGYTLQPAVISAFVAVMMVLFDSIIYSDCIFWLTTTISSSGQQGVPFWELQCILGTNQSCSCTPSCQNSLGYFMATSSAGSSMLIQSWPSSSNALFTYPVFNNMAGLGLGFITALFQGTIFGFIFYFFSKQLAGFAADLTNTPSLGAQALSPTWVVDLSKKVAAFVAKIVYVAVTKDTSPIRQDIEKGIRKGITGALKSGSGMQATRGNNKAGEGSGMSARRGAAGGSAAGGTGAGGGRASSASDAYRPGTAGAAAPARGHSGGSAYQRQVEEGVRRQLDESDAERDIPASDTGRRGGTPGE